jgi:cytochrome c oxidase assembly protein subunit 11
LNQRYAVFGSVSVYRDEYQTEKYFNGIVTGGDCRHDLRLRGAESHLAMNDELQRKNAKLVRTLLLVTVAMFGFGFALVPLYDVLCKVTGLNGKVDSKAVKETGYQVDPSRELTVEFVTALNESAPMAFRAETPKLKVHPGQYYTVNFYAQNQTDKPMIAQAIPSISPGLAAEYFKKTECFCFTEQKFKPREGKAMPVRFVVDPKISPEYKTITLAYTFFDNTEKAEKQ